MILRQILRKIISRISESRDLIQTQGDGDDKIALGEFAALASLEMTRSIVSITINL